MVGSRRLQRLNKPLVVGIKTDKIKPIFSLQANRASMKKEKHVDMQLVC